MIASISNVDFVTVRMGLVEPIGSRRLKDNFGLVRVEDADDDPGHYPSTLAETPIACHIRYLNAGGEPSDRIVTIHKVERRPSGLMLYCWCHKRSALRTFRDDRITELICIATGEIFLDPQRFLAEVGLLPQATPEADALALCQPEVNLLTIVGAADGLFDPDERDVVVGFIFDTAGTLALDEDVIRRRLAAYVPDLLTYQAAVGQLRGFALDRKRHFSRALRRLIDVDGICSKEEQLFAIEIEEALHGV